MIKAARRFLDHPLAVRTRDQAVALRKRPRLLAVLAGALIGFAQPPFGFIPGLFGYALLLFSLEQDLGPRPKRAAYLIGWLAGFVYFLVSCFWVAEAFLVDAKTYGWMAPFAATLLPAGIALFWGAFAVLYRVFHPQGQHRFLHFACLFSIFEILRGTILSGFPWDPSGATWQAGKAMSQMAAFVGVYGLGFITVLIFCGVAVVSTQNGVKGWWPVLFGLGLWVSCFAIGELRLRTTTIGTTSLVVRIVQPNIGQRAKWTKGTFDSIFTDYVAMTKAPSRPGGGFVNWPVITPPKQIMARLQPDPAAPSVVIWPEGALPAAADDLFSADSWTAPVLTTMLRDNQSLIMGVTRTDGELAGRSVWRNSMMVMHQSGKITVVDGFYDKYKLVPFGEFTPFTGVLSRIGVKALTHFDDGFTPGIRTHSVKFNNIPRFLPLICYEGIFPSLDMTSYTSEIDPNRPRWIVNISNDAWFGPTTGPRQHLNLASYRAIEEGLPMVRSTPTGISVLVDPLGRVVPGQKLDLGQRGYLDLTIPSVVKLTAYSGLRFGFVIFLTFFYLILMAFERLVPIIKRNRVLGT